MPLIPVAEWMPDQAPYQSPGAPNIANVLPSALSYRPFKAMTVHSTDALAARARGLWYGRAIDGSARVFAGTATKLYALSGTAWNDVTRASGGDYAVGDEAMWSFVQFGDLLLAFNGTDPAQVFTLSDVVDGSVKFTALGGTPPVAEFVTVVRDFVFTGKIDSAKSTNQWSAINNAASWATSATTMADSQQIPSGGNIRGQAGGEFGIVLQDDAIQRYSFVGPPTVFQRDEIATGIGCSIQGSVASHGNRVFFVHKTGFYELINGNALALKAIGAGKVDRTFWETVDQSYLSRVTSAIDPLNKLYLISFPDGSASSGTPNVVWAYEWEVGRWAPVTGIGNHEMIATGSAQNSLGIDDADGYADDIDAAGAPSLDSEIYAGVVVPKLAAFDTSHKLMFSDGAALAATVDTAEQQPTIGQKSFIRAARPVVEGNATDVRLAIGYRQTLGDAVTFTSESTPSSGDKLCKFRTKARYIRGRITIPAGEDWDHIQGVDEIVFTAAGNR